MTGPIGDEWTFDEVDALLDDERVPLELKALLRLSDAMLVESELAEAELILRYTSQSVRMVKPVGSPCAAVPQRPIIHGMSGAASIPTFDAEDAHLTRTGYCHRRASRPSPSRSATWPSRRLVTGPCCQLASSLGVTHSSLTAIDSGSSRRTVGVGAAGGTTFRQRKKLLPGASQ